MQKLREVERNGEAGQRRKRSKAVVADNETEGTWVTEAQRASPPKKRKCGDRSRNGWVGSGGYGPEASVDDQHIIQKGPVVLVETFAYSASVFVPQVRAQHGAFALLTVRLKLSVLANSALTCCLRSFFIHFEMHVNRSTAMCLSDTLGSIGDECRCVPGTVCIVPV